MRTLRGVGAPVALVWFVAAASARADRPPYDPAVDPQLLHWAIGPDTFFSVADGNVADHRQVAVDAAFTYATDPVRSDGQTIVRGATAGELTAAYGLFGRFQVGVALPVWIDLRGVERDPATGQPGTAGLSIHGIGDVRVELKARLWQRHAVRLAAIVGGTIATSYGNDNSQFTGDQTDSARGRLTLDWTRGPLSLGVDAGGIVRASRDVYTSRVGSAIVLGVAAAYRVTDHFAVIAEAFGQTGPSFAADQSPAEAIAGLRVYATPSISISAGGGAGLTTALGSPQAQVFAAVAYAPDVRDSDGDGIPNSRDRCPAVPEDRDGFQDEDGCPDDDNDGDRRPDAVDKCPNEAEDLDGFQDEDGCPDLDNDRDGIPDATDKCPNEPEDGLPPYPHDGCPANRRDSDGDGVMDADDKCPLEEEDQDGFEDGDGCPDPDNDGDGIPDAKDQCPMCAEDKDGFQDEDGCPEPDDAAVHLDGDQLIVAAPPSVAAARHIAEVIAGHHEVTKWLVAVSAPVAADAKKVAAVITAGLARAGAGATATVVDRVGPAKVAGVVQERATGTVAPNACPAGLEAHERPGTTARPAPPTP